MTPVFEPPPIAHSGIYEKIVLNPAEFTPSLPEIDLSAFGIAIGESGPDYGESSVAVERIKREVGEGVTARQWPSIECTIPLIVSADRSVTQAQAYGPIEQFVAEVQRKGNGWIRRDMSDLNGYSGSLGTPVDAAGLITPKGSQPIDEITLKLMRHPFWFATVETLAGEAKGSAVRDLQLELANLLGTAPGLIRVVVKNEGVEDWRGCYVSLECDDYSSAATAKPKYEAKALTPQGGAAVTTVSGAEVVKCPSLTEGWVTVLSSKIAGVGHMTHVGPRRMIFRIDEVGPFQGEVEWKLEWRANGGPAWIQTEEGSTRIVASSPVMGNYQLLDMGQCRPKLPVTGEPRWEWRVQARATSGNFPRPLIRDVYPMSIEQWLRVSDTSESAIDGELQASPGTAEDTTGVGTVAWTNPGNALATDAEPASCALGKSGVSHYLKLTNLGLPVPAGATIRGVKVLAKVGYGATSAGAVLEDNRIRLVVGGAIKEAQDRAKGVWSTAEGEWPTREWGGTFDLWGLTLTQSQVVASNFGVAISVKTSGGEGVEAWIDSVVIVVAYSEGGNENRICFAGRSLESSNSGVRRQHVTDEVWGELVPEGMQLEAPVGGQEGKPARLLVVPSVGDFATRPDSATVSPSVRAYIRPAYLFAREAA